METIQIQNACNDCGINREGKLLYQCDTHAGKQYNYNVEWLHQDATPKEGEQFFVMSHYGTKIAACKTLKKALAEVQACFAWSGEREFWIVLSKGAVDARRPIKWYQILKEEGSSYAGTIISIHKKVNA